MSFVDRKAHLLSRVELLQPLSPQEINWLASRIPDTRLVGGQMFYTPGYKARLFFLLLEGRMRLYRMVQHQELTIRIIRQGEMFGEAAFANRPQGGYAQTLEPSWVGLVSLATFEQLLQRNPQVGLKVASSLGERLEHYAEQMVDIGLKEVPARLSNLLIRLCESEGVVTPEGYRIPTRYTQEQLGYMIGAKRVAVTRAFTGLRKAGMIKLRQRTIYIISLKALKQVAEQE